jgi:hypothetical protein
MPFSLSVQSGRALAGIAAIGIVAAACQGAGATQSPASVAASPAATVQTAASGSFHKVDGEASGSVALKHLVDGSFEIVFEDFTTPGKDHTNVILVSNVDVVKTTDIDQTAILDLGPLKGTSGMQEYAIPAAMSANAMGYHTVVLWDTTMLHAVAAAPLKGG